MSYSRVIKKYPNRRLYDTEESRYITLADVRELVLDKVEFEVIDKKTGEDITRNILLQVISEQEQQGSAVMSEDFLAQIIRAYGSVMPDFVARYLEQSMKLFMQQQKFVRDQLQSFGDDPISAMTDLAQQNMTRLQGLQDDLLRQLGVKKASVDDANTDATGDDQKKAG
jgi:polyhydroxyalkanoate synthesis repressor PhaR